MKKIAALLLCALLALNTVSCSNDKLLVNEGETQENRPVVTEPVSSETDAVTEEKRDLALGNIDGNTYKSDFIGIGCTLGDGWVFYTDEQIAELNGIRDSLLDDEYLEQMKKATVLYDMYAANQAQSSTINITLEKGTKLGVFMTDIDAVLTKSVDSLKSSFENMGGANFKYELRDVKIGDETFNGMDIYVEINGVPLYETMICIKSSEYLAYVCVASYVDNLSDEILGTFFTVD